MSKLKTSEWFMDEFKKKNDRGLTIIGEYIGVARKIKVKCNVCGREWEVLAQSLLKNIGCSKCSYRQKHHFQWLLCCWRFQDLRPKD